MKIGLTGAKGFIGKQLFNYLSKNHEVIGLRTDEPCNYYTLDALINCARSDKNIFDKDGNLAINPTDEQWVNEFNTDIKLAYEFNLKMAEQNYNLKNIIFISSIYGKIIPTIRQIPPNYVFCKAAEIHMSKYLAVKLKSICVNTIILGGVRSDRPAGQQDDGFLNKYGKKTILGKMTDIKEVYPVIDLLISVKGMTGSEIEISGGYGYY